MAYDFEIETAVRERYGAASQEKEEALCCPVEYDPQYLRILPDEIIERDYGCGDPSAFVKAGRNGSGFRFGRREDLLYRVANRRRGTGKSSALTRTRKCSLWPINIAAEMAEKIGYSQHRNFATEKFRICGSI